FPEAQSLKLKHKYAYCRWAFAKPGGSARPGEGLTPSCFFRRRRLRQPIRKVAGTKAHVARFDVQRHSLKIGPIRRGGRVAEGARLESVFTENRNVESNPTPPAKNSILLLKDN